MKAEPWPEELDLTWTHIKVPCGIRGDRSRPNLHPGLPWWLASPADTAETACRKPLQRGPEVGRCVGRIPRAAAEAPFFRDPLPGAEGGKRERRALSPASGSPGRLLEPSASEARPLDQRSQGRTMPRVKPGPPDSCPGLAPPCSPARLRAGTAAIQGALLTEGPFLPRGLCPLDLRQAQPPRPGVGVGDFAFLLPCSGRKNRGRAHRSDTPGVPGASLGS